MRITWLLVRHYAENSPIWIAHERYVFSPPLLRPILEVSQDSQQGRGHQKHWPGQEESLLGELEAGRRTNGPAAGGRGWDILKPLHQLDLLHGGGAQHLIIISGRCLCSGGQRHQRRGEEDSLSTFLNHFYFLSCNHFCLCQLGSVLDKDPYGLKALVMFQ